MKNVLELSTGPSVPSCIALPCDEHWEMIWFGCKGGLSLFIEPLWFALVPIRQNWPVDDKQP